MYTMLLASVLAMMPLAPQEKTDTVIQVDKNARLELENFSGSVQIRTWDRPEVKVAAEHSSRERLEIRNSMLRLHIETTQDYGDDRDTGDRRRPRATHGSSSRMTDYVLTIPATMAVSITGPYTDVDIDGSRGEINVETVQGEVKVHGGAGNVSLESVQGTITLDGARGRVNVHSVSESVEVRDVIGDVTAETVSGDIRLEKIQGDHVEATTVSGEIGFDGIIKTNGSYSFTSHSGDVTLMIPETSNATVSVSTFSGDFQAGFPVQLDTEDVHKHGKRITFAIGKGGARIEAESFSGDIEIMKPGSSRK
jgi:DUF4097 and DUF4098 domain-containing protein YvlB